MRSTLAAIAAVALAIGLAGFARADDQSDARAIIDKAIKAQGGQELIAKYKGIALKGKGKFHGLGSGIDYNGEWLFQGADQYSIAVDMDVDGMKLRVHMVINGKEGWFKLNNDVMDLDKERLAEERERMYANWVSYWLPVKEKGFELSTTGESKVGDRPAVGVRVAHKERRDLTLYFDKETGLLLKRETRIKDVDVGGNQELSEETYFKEYKSFNGLKRPTQVEILREGKPFVNADLSEQKDHEKIDDSSFAKP